MSTRSSSGRDLLCTGDHPVDETRSNRDHCWDPANRMELDETASAESECFQEGDEARKLGPAGMVSRKTPARAYHAGARSISPGPDKALRRTDKNIQVLTQEVENRTSSCLWFSLQTLQTSPHKIFPYNIPSFYPLKKPLSKRLNSPTVVCFGV